MNFNPQPVFCTVLNHTIYRLIFCFITRWPAVKEEAPRPTRFELPDVFIEEDSIANNILEVASHTLIDKQKAISFRNPSDSFDVVQNIVQVQGTKRTAEMVHSSGENVQCEGMVQFSLHVLLRKLFH
jgi:hypothetical protein